MEKACDSWRFPIPETCPKVSLKATVVFKPNDITIILSYTLCLVLNKLFFSMLTHLDREHIPAEQQGISFSSKYPSDNRKIVEFSTEGIAEKCLSSLKVSTVYQQKHRGTETE